MFLRGILQRTLRRNSSLKAMPSGNWSSCRKGLALLWYIFIINSRGAMLLLLKTFEIFWNKQLSKWPVFFCDQCAQLAAISLDWTSIVIPNPLSALSTQIGCRKNPVERSLNMGWFGWSFLGRLERNPRWKLENPKSPAKKTPEQKTWKWNGFAKEDPHPKRFFSFCRSTNLTKHLRLFDLLVDLQSYRNGDGQSFSFASDAELKRRRVCPRLFLGKHLGDWEVQYQEVFRTRK